jgi:hypothetical protein
MAASAAYWQPSSCSSVAAQRRALSSPLHPEAGDNLTGIFYCFWRVPDRRRRGKGAPAHDVWSSGVRVTVQVLCAYPYALAYCLSRKPPPACCLLPAAYGLPLPSTACRLLPTLTAPYRLPPPQIGRRKLRGVASTAGGEV